MYTYIFNVDCKPTFIFHFYLFMFLFGCLDIIVFLFVVVIIIIIIIIKHIYIYIFGIWTGANVQPKLSIINVLLFFFLSI